MKKGGIIYSLTILVIAVTLPGLLITAVTSNELRVRAGLLAHQDVDRLTQSVAEEGDRLLENSKSLLTILSRVSEMRGEDAASCSAYARQVMQEYDYYDNIGVIGLDGQVICSGLELGKYANASDLIFFRRAIETGGFSVGEYQIGSVTNKAAVNFGYPIRDDASGKVHAVIFAALDLKWLNELAARTHLEPGRTLAIIDRTGTVLARYPEPETWIGRSVADTPLFQHIKERRSGSEEITGGDGVTQLYSYTSLIAADGGAFIAAGTLKGETDKDVNRQFSRNMVAMGSATVAAALLAVLLSLTFIVKPLRRLVEGAGRLARGDFNVKTHDASLRGEIADLAQEFDDMASKLKELYATLEEKVADRTRALEKRGYDLARSQEALLNTLAAVKELNTKIERQRTQLQVILESLPVGVFVGEAPSGKALTINTAGLHILGVKEAAKGGREGYTESYHLVQEDGSPYPAASFPATATLATGRPATKDDVFTKRPDGTLVALRVSTAPAVKDADGNLVSYVAVFEDMTQDYLIDKQKSEFISIASHQLRTPLTAIKWFLEMIIKGDVGKVKKEQLDYLTQVFESNERMISLVNDLLNVSRIEAGRVGVEPVATDMNAMIRSVFAEFSPLVAQKKLKVSYNDARLPLIRIDPKLVRQVFMNLVSNAVKYTPDEGKVSLFAEKRGTELVFSVSDSGMGIPLGQQQLIFKKFFRADNAIGSTTEGTGLGLYVAKQVVELSGGRIWFESAEGKGSTFHFTLPRKGSVAKSGSVGLA